MFSTTTTELSTSIPTATARPESEIILIVTPEKYMSTMAKTRLSGIETSVMIVGRQSRRNKNTENSAPHSSDERIVRTMRLM